MQKQAISRRAAAKSVQLAAFGRVLYALRIEKGLSQEELSFRSEIDRSYVSQLERGEKEPCLGVVFQLSDALGTPTSEIFSAVERIRSEKPQSAKRNARVR